MEGHQTPPSGDDELREQENSRRNPALTAARGRKKERRRAVALLPEHRYFAPSELEIRSTAETDQISISGSPIVYAPTSYRVADPWGAFEERIHAGAVTDLLARGVDCRLLLNHEGLPMARTTAGTMDLQDTPTALRFTARLDARSQLSNDFHLAIARRDITQMSIGMLVGDDEWGEEDGMETRDIFVVADLVDVSGVTYPCSESTSIEIAQRMAMRLPVESRARLRRFYLDGRAGKTLAPERFEALRSMLDPGEDLQTPEGTGPLGHPDGNGQTWSDPGDSVPGDGTVGSGSQDGSQDATGSREADGEDVEQREDEPTSETSRATRLRVKRALRGI